MHLYYTNLPPLTRALLIFKSTCLKKVTYLLSRGLILVFTRSLMYLLLWWADLTFHFNAMLMNTLLIFRELLMNGE